MKGISRHIKNLISNNPNLTVKHLSYILFEIMGNTRLGLDIVDENYPYLGGKIIDTLTEKYKYDKFDNQ